MDPLEALLHDEESAVFGEAAPAIYQTSLFAFDSAEAFEVAAQDTERPFYTRGTNPTVRLLERKIAALEKTEDARAFSSGMGAIAATLFAFLKPGDRVVATTPVYAGTHALLTGLLRRFGVTTEFVPATDTEAILKALPGAKLLYLESPASYTFEVVDLEPLTRAARALGIVSVIDATYTAGLLSRPHEWGVDLVVHSASKYFSGHSDTIAGVVAGSRSHLKAIRETYMLLGAKLAPYEAWLVVRGLRTLPLRLERHAKNAEAAAAFLAEHPAVKRVYYPTLPADPSYPLAQKYLKRGASLVGVELLDEDAARRFVNRLRTFKIGVSWGGHESLAMPLALQPRVARAYRFPGGFVRLHVGLDEVGRVLEDLEQALSR